MEQQKGLFLKKIWHHFSPYEKIWYFTSIGLMLFLLIFFFDDVISSEGEESFIGNTFFVICTVVAIFANLTCELLISKQSYWNFIVSLLFIEIMECIIFFSMKDYATALVTLCFWIPIDIVSFCSWGKKKDKYNPELTKVRKLTPAQDVLLCVALVIFTVWVGYLLTLVGGEETYADACVAGLGIANGLLILFRYREQWVVWILCLIAEASLLIMNGQYITLVKSVALIVNSVYGMIMWTRYIQSRKKEVAEDKSIL